MNRIWPPVAFSCGLLAILPLHADPADQPVDPPIDPPAQTQEQPKPSKLDLGLAEEIESLIRQLGDDDFKTREKATDRLREIGPDALPALQEAATSSDPEAAARAESLIKTIRHKPSLMALPRTKAGGLLGQRVQVTIINGARRADVFDGDVHVEIVEGQDGIDVTVSAIQDAKHVTQTVHAKNPDELKLKDPDAFALYSKWGSNGQGPVLPDFPPGVFPGPVGPFGPGPFPPGIRPPGIPGPLIIRGGPRPVLLGGDDLLRLRQTVRRQLLDADHAQEDQAAILGRIDELIAIQRDPVPPDRNALDERMKLYNQKCDELRDRMAALKLPDPGDVLPPPAKARLGISLGPDVADGVSVNQVLPDSRGEKIGLKPQDVIRKVNDRPVTSALDLRKALIAAEKDLVLEVSRDGADVRLEEKTPEKD